jgi:AcrR family transcriptional regulator
VSKTLKAGRRPGHTISREAILTAARHQFADLGYDRATVRSIAAEAGVDSRLVAHFFGTKQELFLSVVEPPLQGQQVFPNLLSGDPNEAGLRVAHFIVGLLESEASSRVMTGMLRAATTEPKVVPLVRELLMRRLLGPLAENLGSDQPLLRASLVASQVVGLVMARYIIGIEPIASETPDRVISTIAPVLQHYLFDPL